MLLLAASAVTIALSEVIDGAFILFFVFLGTALNVYQEYKSNAAADKLKSYFVRSITVRRDGKDQGVPVVDIVPGDILNLESGDIVPADAIVRRAHNGAIVSLIDGSQLHIRRGSPEYFFDQGLVNRDRLGSWLEEEENHGRRVLGVSYDDGSGPRFNLLFEFTMPTLDHLALIMGLAVLYLIASEVVKRPIARFLNKDQ